MFATYTWLPHDVHLAVSVRLDDKRWPIALDALDAFSGKSATAGPVARRMKAELPGLLRLFHEVGYAPGEAVYFLTEPDAGVWAVPTRCDAAELTRLASHLGLEILAVDGVASAVVAVSAPSGYGFVQFSSGQMWVGSAANNEGLLAWLATMTGSHPGREEGAGILGFQLREGRREATLQMWSNEPHDPYHISEIRVDGAKLSAGSVRYYMPMPVER